MKTLRDVMNPRIESVDSTTTLQDAAKRMRDRDIGLLTVQDGGRILGTVTDRDMCVNAVANGLEPGKTAVENAMTPHVVTCDAGDDLEAAARAMTDHKVRRVVVTADGAPVGVVSIGDLARGSEDKALVGKTLQAVS